MPFQEPEIITIDSKKEGPALVVLGAIHGNEPCGPEAIRQAIKYLNEDNVSIEAGRIVFVPVANPLAFKQQKRWVDRDNLNRHFYMYQHTIANEDRLANILCPILQKADFLLDIHSYHAAGGPFVFFQPPNPEEISFARALGVNDYVHGWQDAFYEKGEDSKNSQGTTEYTRLFRGHAVTLECGSHLNKDASAIGLRAIFNAVKHLGIAQICDDVLSSPASRGQERCVKMNQRFLMKEEGGILTQKFKNLDFVHKDQVLARFPNGENIVAPEDGYIVFPKPTEEVGAEWFYFGVESEALTPRCT